MKPSSNYYRHFKGGIYRFVGIAKDSEDPDKEFVVYQAMYGEKGLWVRPKEMFFSQIERNGYKGPRFLPISEEEALSSVE